MPTSDQVTDDQAPLPRSPDFRDLRRRGRELQHALDTGRTDPASLLDDAEKLLQDAKAAGAVAWLRRDRDQIDLAMNRAFQVYEAADAQIPSDLAEPEVFDDTPAKFVKVTQGQAVTRLARGEEIVGGRLEGVDLREVRSARRARVIDCVLIDCDLRGLDLSESVLVHCVFSGCKLSGVDLSGAVVSSCRFNGIPTDDRGGMGLEGVRAVGAQFSASQFYNVTFSEDFNASGSAFSYAQIVRCVAEGGASFRGARFDLATIDDFDARGACFDDASFVGAAFMDTDMRGTSLRGSVFSSARFASVDFRAADFSARTRLRSAYFGGKDALRQNVYRFDAGVLVADLSKADHDRIQAWLNSR